ncbi:AraC family transcriptional regulator [Gallaecimonas kandeliae]|uniref:AraC family transcriptional regulator n=1 Tax=Gallaecimonas kandeliae TaxID=3029055 RepID=UPI0026485A3D|nr:AraC family transcriptional regulator [Gallaecimonas kandeliae]WKE66491.1 AraC family transcriptional regulator [Gallaecimonas kandeliae]
MDSLSQLIGLLAPKGQVDLHCRFSGSWQSDHPQAPKGHLPYHLILAGQAKLLAEGREWQLAAGDVLLLPQGSPHLLKGLRQGDRPAPQHRRHNGAVTELVRAGEGEALEMLCGEFQVGAPGALLLASMPALVQVRTAQRDDCAELKALVAMLARESLDGQPGAQAIIRELSATLLTLLLRALLTQQAPPPGLLNLMADQRLAPAVAAVLAEPQGNWTLEAMAAACHLSRASFARHFGQCYQLTPQEWLTQLRMALAARLLRESPQGLLRVAEQCGYLSQAAFSRAFKAHHGQTPGQFRRHIG